jgi:hypothetical protein
VAREESVQVTDHQEAFMHVTKRTAIGLLSAAALGWSAISGAVSALGHSDHGHHRGRTLLNATLAPTVPTDPTIHGVAAGGLPWVLDSGHARLRHDGRLSVRVRGLVIPVAPGNGTPGPVTSVSASLYCGADATPAVATTASVPLSSTGDARIDERVTLPAKCLAPIVLVHPNGGAAAYIAATGFGG